MNNNNRMETWRAPSMCRCSVQSGDPWGCGAEQTSPAAVPDRFFFLALTRSLSSTAGPGPEHASVCNVRVRGPDSKTPNRLGLSVCPGPPSNRPGSIHPQATVRSTLVWRLQVLSRTVSAACDSRLAAACWVLLCFAPRRQSSHGYGTG